MSGAVFREVSLDRAEFSKTDLTNTMFQKSELRNLKVKESNLKTVFQNCRLQGSQIYCSDIKQIDFSESDIKHIQFIKDRIARESPLIFKNTIVDMKLLLEVERLFGDIVQNCRVDMCDNLLTYAEYCRFREKKQGKLQKEILNLLETGKNYSEWEEDAE